jgi:light-regulated signal transduction histidine kinase (bacteriophytochrome)
VVTGDRNMLLILITNFLSNSIKFTGHVPVAVIEIRCTGGDTEDVFFVKDNGVGFNTEYSHKLFKLFERLHEQDEFPGTGPGLANSKRIIQRHGGRIGAEGTLGKGATFYFSLPGTHGEKTS